MKLHRPLLEAVSSALSEIFIGGKQADDTVRSLLASRQKWGSRDRRWVAEVIYDIVRWWRLYCHLGNFDYLHPANVQWDQIIAIALLQKNIPPENPSLLPAYADLEKNIRQQDSSTFPLAVQTSFPDWLFQLGQAELGDRWPETAIALNDTAAVFLRCNTLKISREKLLQLFKEAGIQAEEDHRSPEAIRLLQRVQLQSHPLYKAGCFEIQDIASQQVGFFCQPKAGQLIADVCAGAGGKSLHLAALSRGKATILASDIALQRIRSLQERSLRAGAKNVKIVSPEALGQYKGEFDLILMDVPCSGTGVIRRNPDTKWKLTEQKLEEYRLEQRNILQQYCQLVRRGGKLVYATCSIFPSEGEMQIRRFLEEHPEFALENSARYWPQDGYDGFYVAEILNS